MSVCLSQNMNHIIKRGKFLPGIMILEEKSVSHELAITKRKRDAMGHGYVLIPVKK